MHPCDTEPTTPEFLSVANATRVFGISRSSLYELIQEGAIQSVNLRKRGAIRGKRLISYDSLKEYLLQFAEGGKNARD